MPQSQFGPGQGRRQDYVNVLTVIFRTLLFLHLCCI